MKRNETNILWYESRLKAKTKYRKYWKKRNTFAKLLEVYDYRVTEHDNCWRLNAYKGAGTDVEQFIIDCKYDEMFHTSVLPVKWITNKDDKTSGPVLVTDIPNSGKYGVWNKDSKYLNGILLLKDRIYGLE